MFLIFAASVFELGREAAWWYLGFIILSRFGHCGFILCEMQIRQETVPERRLGLVNGIAVSLNSVGAVIVLFLGAVLSDPADFGYLVWTSAAAITCCALISYYWAMHGKGRYLHRPAMPPAQAPEGISQVA